MADPQVKETLLSMDKLSIASYRFGMLLTPLCFIGLAYQQLYLPLGYKSLIVWLALAVFLQAANLHIYDKKIRYALVTSAWFGVWFVSLSLLMNGLLFAHLSLAGLFVCLAGISYKESFCFSLSILKLNPVFLVLLWICLLLGTPLWSAIFALSSAGLSAYMAYKKVRMPLYYDIGDRSKYQN